MPAPIRAAFFDVDGVLLDSLPEHLRCCTDTARRYGLKDITVPDAAAFRRMVAGGVKVSPMLNFFLAVGFPQRDAQRAVVDYARDFARLYRPQAFRGHAAMLRQLRGITLGLVTANTRSNVEPALGDVMACFDPRGLFFVDSSVDPSGQPRPKSWCLAEGARMLDLAPAQCLFVGDQPADADAAEEAGVGFIGVSYGWGFTGDEKHWPMVQRIGDLAKVIRDARIPG